MTLVRKDHNHRLDSSYALPRVMVLDMDPMVFPALHSQTAARSLELGLATSSRCTERSGRDTSGRTSTWYIASSSLSGYLKVCEYFTFTERMQVPTSAL